MKEQESITYNKGNFVGQNCRTEAMLTSNNIAKFFNKSICDGNKKGVPYGICNNLTRITQYRV